MAKRLNKNLVVLLTLLGMGLATAAGIVMVLNLPQKTPKQFLEQAEAFEKKKEYKEAATYYARAAARARNMDDRSSANAYMTKAGDVALLAGDAKSAIQMWNQVFVTDPTQIQAQEKVVNFSLEYAQLTSNKEVWGRLSVDAQKLLDNAKRMGVTSYVGLHALGDSLVVQRLVKESNLAEGKKDLTEAFDGDKGNPGYARSLANCLMIEGIDLAAKPGQESAATQLVKDAAAVFDTAAANAPKDDEKKAKLSLYRGQFYARKEVASVVGAPEAQAKALEAFQNALSLAPNNVDVITGVGDYWHARMIRATVDKAPPQEIDGYREKAKQAYKDAIHADPDHYVGYLSLASLFIEQRQFDAANKVLDDRLGLPLNREHYQSWMFAQYNNMARENAFKATLGKYGEEMAKATSADQAKALGVPIMERLKKIHHETEAEGGQDDMLAHFMQGRIKFLENDTFAAKAEFEKAQELASAESPEIARYLAIIYAKINSPGAAQKAVNIVLSVAPDDMSTLVIKANIENQLGHPQDAIQAADRVLAQDAHNGDALQAKGRACEQLKNYECVAEINKILSAGKGTDREKIVEAMTLHQQAITGDKVDEVKLAQAASAYQQILQENPTNGAALSQLINILSRKPEDFPKIKALLDAARAEYQKKLSVAAASQPSGDEANTLTRQILALDVSEVSLDPSIKPEDKAKRKEELAQKIQDPFIQAMTLSQIHKDAGQSQQALEDLQKAYQLKPDDPMTTETLLQLAIANANWNLAEDVTKTAVLKGVEKSGGHMYRGEIALARSKEKQEYLADAEREFRAAILQLPDFAEAWAQLGNALNAQGRNVDARAAYDKALQLNPRNPYGLIGMALIATAEGKDDERKKFLARAAEVVPDNSWIKSQMQQGEDESDPDKGIARREQMRTSNPNDVDNLLRLADLYRRKKDDANAVKTFELAVAVQPDNLQIPVIYARYQLNRQPPDIAAGRAVLDKAVKAIDANDKKRKSAGQLVYAAFLNQILSQVPANTKDAPTREEADKAFLAANDINASAPIQFEIGRYFIQTNRVDQGLTWFRNAVKTADAANQKAESKASSQAVIETLLQTIKPEGYAQTRKEIDDFRAKYPDDAVAIRYAAEFADLTGHPEDALKAYGDYITRAPDDANGYYKRALTQFMLGNWDPAVKDLQTLKQKAPMYQNGRGRLILADALVQSHQPDQAIAELQSLLDASPPPREMASALQGLFDLYLNLKRYDSAESLTNTRAQSNPDIPEWDALRAQIAAARGDSEGQARLIRSAVEKSKFNLSYVQQYLALLISQKKYDDLIAFVDQKIPEPLRGDMVAISQASAYAGKGDLPRALDLYAKAVSTPPVDVSILSNAMGADANLKGHAEEVRKELEARYQKDPKSRVNRLLLATVRRLLADRDGTLALLKELAADSKNDTPQLKREQVYTYRALATLLNESQKWNESREAYQKVLEYDDKDPVALNNLAYLLMDQFNDPKAALPYSRRVTEIMTDNTPQRAGVLDTLGWNLVLLGQYDEAISQLGKAVQLNTRLGEPHYHLAEGYYRRSQAPGATSAAVDLEQAKKELKLANQFMTGTDDPDKVREKIAALATKMGVTLTAAPANPVAPGAR